MGVCKRGVNERPREAETSPKTKTTEIMARLYKTMLANTCRRLRSRIGRAMEAGVIYWVKLESDIQRNTYAKFQVNTFTFIEVMTVFVMLERLS